MVSGTGGGDGGTVAFETAFASQAVAGTVGDTAISTAQTTAHRHDILETESTTGALRGTAFNHNIDSISNAASVSTHDVLSDVGSGSTHTHSFGGSAIDMDVEFIDMILAARD